MMEVSVHMEGARMVRSTQITTKQIVLTRMGVHNKKDTGTIKGDIRRVAITSMILLIKDNRDTLHKLKHYLMTLMGIMALEILVDPEG